MLQRLSFRVADVTDVQIARKQNGTVCFAEDKY